MHPPSARDLIRPLCAFACLALIVASGDLIVRGASPTMRYYFERAEFALHPSAAQACAFGASHLNVNDPDDHDIDRAEYFYRQCAALDPRYPLVYHQLARIDFLRGNFRAAIAEIDQDIALEGDTNPHAYYVRGLIEGYQSKYADAADDFARFLQFDPAVWAGYNDESWVLMKAGKYTEARDVLVKGLAQFPTNAWLLNSYAIALFELGDKAKAATVAAQAEEAVMKLTPEDWLHADPGNDPAIAADGLGTFQQAALTNLEKIKSVPGTAAVTRE